MKTLYWTDIKATLENMGLSLQLDPNGPGLQWADEDHVLCCQAWGETPREFHWRTLCAATNAIRVVASS